MPLPSLKPTSVEVSWKYREESIQTIRHGITLNKPNTDSDLVIDGIQNEGLVDVKFKPQAEKIDIYYRPLNEIGRGPVVNIISTGRSYKLNAAINKDINTILLAGDITKNPIAVDSIIQIDDEFMHVTAINQTMQGGLLTDLVEFWSLQETSGDRLGLNNIDLEQYTEHELATAAGYLPNTLAADFTGSSINRQALFIPYRDELALGTVNNGFTVSAWIKIDDQSQGGTILGRWGSIGRNEYRLSYSSIGNGEFRFFISDGEDNTANVSIPVALDINVWYLLVGRFDPVAETITLNILSTMLNEVNSTPFIHTPAATGAHLCIGAEFDDNINNPLTPDVIESINGKIASIGFWKRQLSTAEITQLRSAYDISSFVRTGLSVTVEDRGSHGSEAVAHLVDATVDVMRTTVPTNSIIMDALLDNVLPGPPLSIVVSASGDDAEIGFEVVVTPPSVGFKTLKRLQIQASTVLWPSTLQHTTGVKTILAGPHTGEIRQDGDVLVSSVDLPALAEPYDLYTYEDIDNNFGNITAPNVYRIADITGRNITIEGKFNVSKGITGQIKVVNFFVFRSWLSVPRDYVVNATPIVTPPAGDVYSQEPFQSFFKTTQSVYIRAKYVNNDGTGIWLYWDGVEGSIDRNNAIRFSSVGLVLANREIIYMYGMLRMDANGDIIQPPELDRTNLITPVSVNVTGDVPAGWSDLQLAAIEANPVVVFTARRYDENTLTWGVYDTPEIFTIWLGLDALHARSGAPLAPVTSFTPAILETSELYAFLVGVGRDVTERELVVLSKTEIQITSDPNAALNFDPNDVGFTDASLLIHEETLTPAPVLWTAPIARYGIYFMTARVQNAKDNTWSLWRVPVSAVTTRDGVDTGFASAPVLRVDNTGDMTEVRLVTITRPELNFATIWGYTLQVRTSAFPADTDALNYTFGLQDIEFKGTGLIKISENEFTIENVNPPIAGADLVGRVLYIHKGVNADNAVEFPHGDLIVAFDAATNIITVSPTQRYRVRSYQTNQPPTDEDRRFMFLIADWMRVSNEIILLTTIIILNTVIGGAYAVPPITAEQYTLPANAHVRARPNNLYGACPFSNVAIVGSTEVPDNVTGLHAALLIAMDMPVIEVDWNPVDNATYYEWREATFIIQGTPSYGRWNRIRGGVEIIRSNIQENTTYYFQVRAGNQNGLSVKPWPTVQLVVGGIVTTVPDSVMGLVASVSGRTITVSWDPADRATSYEWRERVSLGGSWSDWVSVGGISIIRANRTRGTRYYYEVRAVNLIGMSALPDASANALVPIVPPIPGVPSAVTGLSATIIDLTSIRVTWNEVSDATSYRIRENSRPSSTLLGTTRTYTDRDPGRPYIYTVWAVNSAGDSAPRNVRITVPAVTMVPGPVTGFSAVVQEFTEGTPPQPVIDIRLSWNAAARATRYTVTEGSNTHMVTGEVIFFHSVDFDTTYNFTIVGVNSVGDGPSASTSVTTPEEPEDVVIPGAPTNLVITDSVNPLDPARRIILLTWTAAPDSSSHEWRRGNDSWHSVSGTRANPTAAVGATYTYHVRGVNSQGDPGPSISDTITI